MESSSLLRKIIACTIASGALFSSKESAAWSQYTFIGNEYFCGIGFTDNNSDPNDDHGRVAQQVCGWVSNYEVVYGSGIAHDDHEQDDHGGANEMAGGTGGPESPSLQEPKVPCNGTVTANPVIVSSGEKVLSAMDFTSEGAMPLKLERSYRSHMAAIGAFGGNWSSSIDYGINFKHGVDLCNSKLSSSTTCDTSTTGLATVYLQRPSGGSLPFSLGTDGAWHYAGDLTKYALTSQSGGWLLTARDGSSETYNAGGQPVSIRNENGIGWNFSYDVGGKLTSIAHTNGRSMSFTWSTNHVSTVITPEGKTYTYNYETLDYGSQLVSVVSPDSLGAITYFHEFYGNPGAITGIAINGIRKTRYGYNADGTVAWSGLEGGYEKDTFAYNENYTDVTNALGQTKRYNLTAVNGSKVISSEVRPASLACPSGTISSQFNTTGAVTNQTNANGAKSEFTYTATGKLASQVIGIAPNGDHSKAQVTEYTWDSTEEHLLSTKIYSLASANLTKEIANEYFPNNDAQGRRNLVKQVTIYDRSTKIYPSPSRSIAYDYTMYSNQTIAQMRVDGPLSGASDLTTYDYDTVGNLTKITNALSQSINYSNYDSMGRVGRIVDANGVVTVYLYDARGRVKKRTITSTGLSRVIDYTYDIFDHLINVQSNDGNWIAYEYNAQGQLLSVSQQGDNLTVDESFNKIEYSYNLYNQRTSQRAKTYDTYFTTYTDPEGNVEQVPHTTTTEYRSSFSDYDQAGLKSADRKNHGENVRYFYDESGRMASVTDSLNRVTSYGYDDLGHVSSVLAPDTGLTQFEYNIQGDLVKVTDPRGKITQYNYNIFGDLLSLTSPDTGTSQFTYDQAGRLIQKDTSDGRATTYGYDLLNRLTTTAETWPMTNSAYSGLPPTTKTRSYDTCLNGIGRLCGFTDASGSTSYEYTSRGQFSKQTTVIGTKSYVLIWTYDGFGRLSQFTYPNGNAVRYTYDSKQRITKMESRIGATGAWANAVSEIKYQPFGPIFSLKNANGLYRTKSFDSSGRLTSINNGTGVQNLAFSYNANDLITSITNSIQTSSNQTYAYDTMSRLITANGGAAGNQSYTYDLNSNRNAHTWSGATDTNVISTANNALTGITGSRPRSFTRDLVGNVTSDAQSGVATDSVYNNSNRLWLVKRNSPVNVCRPTGQCFNLVAGIWQYDHNALGQRASKTTSLTNGTIVTKRHYVYGPDGRLLAEADGNTGVIDTSYIWLGAEPLALIKGSNFYNIHVDQLGRPEKVTNSSKVVVWKAENYAFDRKVTLDNIGGLNLGFSGQYYDQETETFYNYFRTYDGSLGRYAQSDPIGLHAGLNTFGYVSSNPVGRSDRFGLKDFFLGFDIDFALEETGFDFGFGLVFDFTNPGQSGYYVEYGKAKGSSAGAAVGAGYVCRDIEGKGSAYDLNAGPVSPTLLTDDKGLNGAMLTLGPGLGASKSEGETWTLTIDSLTQFIEGIGNGP